MGEGREKALASLLLTRTGPISKLGARNLRGLTIQSITGTHPMVNQNVCHSMKPDI